MKKNVIAINAYNKPDLLFLFLEQIFKDDFSKDFSIRIYLEEGYDKEEDDVIEYYINKFIHRDIQSVTQPKHPRCPLIGFHHCMTCFSLAAKEAKDFIIISEEDTIPTDDFVKFNTYVYYNYLSKYDRIFCVAHKRRVEIEKVGNHEVLIGDYQCTLPTCVSVRAIKQYLEPYFIMPGYFDNPVLFNFMHFSDSRIHPQEVIHCDGAIERIMWKHKLFSLKPDQARSMHVGISGTHCRGSVPRGSLADRVFQWRELIKDGNKLRSMTSNPQDIGVTSLVGPKWDKLILDTDRNIAKASSWWYDSNNEFKTYINNNI